MNSSKSPGKGDVLRTARCGQARALDHLPPDAAGKHGEPPLGVKRTKRDVPVPGLEPGQHGFKGRCAANYAIPDRTHRGSASSADITAGTRIPVTPIRR